MGAGDSVLILSGNSIEHALVMLGCYTAGVPAAPISPAYSLMSQDLAKLKHCYGVVRPKAVFAQSGAQFERALAALRALDPGLLVITADGAGEADRPGRPGDDGAHARGRGRPRRPRPRQRG